MFIKRGKMSRRSKNRTVWGVVGVILTLFGAIGTIPVLLNKDYILGLPLTALSVIGGIILIAWSFSD
ncbi:hypothetical protein COU57_04705 [Candidatus Pacearchaeota archaeon CG10_big_fil_rev_8_21_14_0_10_32_14]|nr:MAG: hypothetical protein COU57_04705 [Candidatus Pacearchaeota archaeon CG10_big_fil_rev_8_21_14_0_10_32_14]